MANRMFTAGLFQFRNKLELGLAAHMLPNGRRCIDRMIRAYITFKDFTCPRGTPKQDPHNAIPLKPTCMPFLDYW